MNRSTLVTECKMFGLKIFLFLIICCVAGCVNQQAANQHLNYGMAYIESGHYTQGLKELLEAKKNNPRDPKIRYFLAICYHGKGLPNEAIGELREAVEMKPDYSEAHNLLGTIYAETDRLDEAISEFQKALANLLYETPSFALNGLGWAYYKKGQYDAALGRFQEILDRDPASSILPLVEKNMGIVYFAQGDYGQSLKHLRRSAELAPDFARDQLHFWMGKALAALGDLEGARSEFRKSIKAAYNSQYSLDSAAELEKLRMKEDATPPVKAPVPAPEAQAPPAPAKQVETARPPEKAERAESSQTGKSETQRAGVAAARPLIHTVVKGETLYSIARAHAVTVQELVRANGLTPGYRVKTGDRLRVPLQGDQPSKSREAMIRYRVKPGDSLSSVAKKFATTPVAIKELNKLKSDYLIKGQLLDIPAGR